MSAERFPGYDVLAKRHTPSWNEPTRRVLDARLALPGAPRFCTEAEWQTLAALCARILPQPADRAPVPLAAMIDDRLVADRRDGYRRVGLPPLREAWRRGLAGLDEAALEAGGRHFHALDDTAQDQLLRHAAADDLRNAAWQGLSSALFFCHRAVPDIAGAYYAHPTAWSEIGFGGPASPRGYVRMGLDRRDPWEAVEAQPGDEAAEAGARAANRHVG